MSTVSIVNVAISTSATPLYSALHHSAPLLPYLGVVKTDKEYIESESESDVLLPDPTTNTTNFKLIDIVIVVAVAVAI